MLDEILIWSTASSQQQLDIVQACSKRQLEKYQSGSR
jgi:predicted Fe-S protein YdhL (DUF1289 family)